MIYRLLGDISAHSSIIPLLSGVIFFRDFSKDLKLYAIFFTIAVIFDQIITYLSSQQQNTWLLINFWILIEYVVTIYVLSYWQKNNKLQKVLRWSIPVYTIFWLIAKIFQIEDLHWFPQYTRSIASIILTIVAIYTLVKLGETGTLIHKHYQFWVCIGVLFYFSGNIILFSLSDLKLMINLYYIHSILNISANFLYAGGFWCHHYQLKHGISFF
jgi:hypothetical protein